MGKNPAFQFYPGDWVRDTRHLSLAAKGAWIDILSAMHFSQTRGKVTRTMVEYARLIGATVEQAEAVIEELATGDQPVCDRDTLQDGRVSLTCRRMVREENERAAEREKKQKQRHPAGVPPDVPALSPRLSRDCPVPSSSSSSTSSSLSLKKRENKSDHLQKVQALRDNPIGG